MTRPQPVNVTVEATIPAPPEAVYDLVADITRMGEWSPETTDADWIKGATGAVEGARFKGTNRLGRASWSTKPTITEARRGAAFAFKVPGKSGPTWRYDFEAVAGGTRVIESVRQAAPSPAIIRLIQRRNGVTDRSAHLADGMRTTLVNLAAAV
ncbi:MAG: SRPBCC family protein [Actinomycetota bacterium]